MKSANTTSAHASAANMASSTSDGSTGGSSRTQPTRENPPTEQYEVQVHKEHAAREARHDLGNLLLKAALALFGRSLRQSALMLHSMTALTPRL
jgi:hypothetical protein